MYPEVVTCCALLGLWWMLGQKLLYFGWAVEVRLGV
jgi:hypothetical protein